MGNTFVFGPPNQIVCKLGAFDHWPHRFHEVLKKYFPAAQTGQQSWLISQTLPVTLLPEACLLGIRSVSPRPYPLKGIG